MPETRPAPASVLRAPRERAIATLTEAFARDDLELEELESRLSRAHTADTPEAIELLVADLPAATEPASALALVPLSEARSTDTTMAILGSTERRGAWLVPRALRARSVLGSTVLDFREARLPVGVVDVAVSAVLGSIEIIVPPGLAVEVHGMGVLGSFESVERAPSTPDPERPVLRVHGVAVLGSVEVRTELPRGSKALTRRE